MDKTTVWEGAMAGLIGTAVMTTIYKVGEHYQLFPSQDQSPVQRLAAEASENTAETGPLAAALHFAYGAAFGAAFGLAQKQLRGSVEVSGTVLGLSLWGLGYLGWTPAMGLYPKIESQHGSYFWAPLVLHLAYGLGTAYAFHELFEPSWTTRLKRRLVWSLGTTFAKVAIQRALKSVA